MRTVYWAMGAALLGLCSCGSDAGSVGSDPEGPPSSDSGARPVSTGGGSSVGGARATGGGGRGGARPEAGTTGGYAGNGGAMGGHAGNGGATESGGSAGTASPADAAAGCGGGPKPEAGSSDLTPGIWKNITPPGGAGASMSCIAIDPSSPLTIYAGINWKSLWKTTDGGKTWAVLGTGADENIYDRSTSYLDDASTMAVDPSDPSHLYLSKGVDGSDIGFWISHDGGQTWTMPAGFPATGASSDVTAMAVDPCDFRHILLGSHGWWGNTGKAGIMESTDGGETWIAHAPEQFPAGSIGVSFLYDPTTGTGDSQTWLVIADGFWRTTDSGESWTKVSDAGGVHGSAETYYAKNGNLFSGGYPHPNRSTDNGLTWTALTDGVPNSAYYTIGGDGENLYLMADGNPPGQGYLTSKESDGLKWVPYADTTKPSRSPLNIRFDPVNGILYSANWDAGLWALKVR
jgi:hypothetical protein